MTNILITAPNLIKGFFKGLFNVFSSPRVIFTLQMIVLYRFLTHIDLPFVDLSLLGDIKEQSQIMSFLNHISGDSIRRMAITWLFIGPSIQASIMMNSISLALPYFRNLKKDPYQRNKRRIYTIILTLLLSFGFAIHHIYVLADIPGGFMLDRSFYAKFILIMVLVTTTMILSWIAERITERGIGNGTGVLMLCSILSLLSSYLYKKFITEQDYTMNFDVQCIMVIIVSFSLIVIFGETVCYNIKIFFKRSKPIGNIKRDYSILPFRLNPASIMPVIVSMHFIGFIKWALGSIFPLFSINIDVNNLDPYTDLIMQAIGIVICTFVYLPLSVDPEDVAESMTNIDAYSPGVKEGQKTIEMLANILSLLCIIAAVYLVTIMIVPNAILLALGAANNRFTSMVLTLAIYTSMDLYDRVVPDAKQ